MKLSENSATLGWHVYYPCRQHDNNHDSIKHELISIKSRSNYHIPYCPLSTWMSCPTKLRRPPTKLAKRASAAHSRSAVASTLRARESALFRPVRSISAVTDSTDLGAVQLIYQVSIIITTVTTSHMKASRIYFMIVVYSCILLYMLHDFANYVPCNFNIYPSHRAKACPSPCRPWAMLPFSPPALDAGFASLNVRSCGLHTLALVSMKRWEHELNMRQNVMICLKVTVIQSYCSMSTPDLQTLKVEAHSHPKVRSLTTVGEIVITALKLDIVVWHKLTEVGRFRGHHSSATVLCAVGSSYLLSAAKQELILWQLSDIGKDESTGILGPLGRPSLAKNFGEVTCICHPPTYLNKILVGGLGGQLELWNIRSMDRIHSFKCISGDAITAMKEANALDVVALGFATGRITLMNVREDKILFETR